MPSRVARSSLPLAVVAALSVAAIVPHLNQSKTPGEVRSTGDGAASGATSGTPPEGQTAITDLLADEFQVDISERGLTRRVDAAADVLASGDDKASALLVGAFLCGEPTRRHDHYQERVRRSAWDLSGGSNNFVPCAKSTAPGLANPNEELAEYVETRLGVESFDKSLLVRTILHDAVGDAAMKFLIATVPDPVDSYETWQFDPMLDALRQAIEESNYTFRRFQFPDVAVEQKPQTSLSGQKELHRHWPGVMLFTQQDERKVVRSDTGQVLVLFLIPETPTAGIHHEPFERAIGFITSWVAEERELKPDLKVHEASALIGVVGPSFSGSTRSLAKAFQQAEKVLGKLPCTPIQVISGNASNSNNKMILGDAIKVPCTAPEDVARTRAPGKVDAKESHFGLQFYSTIHPNETMRAAVTWFKESRMGIPGRIATITENTAYGQNTAEETRDLQITVPYNIAQLREGTNTAARVTPPFDTVLPSVRPLPLADLVIPTDQPIVRTPQTMAAYVELVIRNLIDVIRHSGVRAVVITMTDVRDRLFLVKELAQRAPDLMIFVTDGDLFYAHPEQYAWTKNLIIVSSYPLHVPMQQSRRGDRVHQYANLGSEGVYNAALALLASTGESGANSSAPRLIDYSLSTCDRSSDDEGVPSPPVWINVVSRGALWPVDVKSVCDKQSAGYMFPGQPVAATNTGVTATPFTVAVLMAIVMCISAIGFAAARLLVPTWMVRRLGFAAAGILLAMTVLDSATLRVGIAVFSLAVAPALFAWPAVRGDFRCVRVEAALTVSLWLVVGAFLWAVAQQTGIFQERFLDIENGVSALVPTLLLCAVPLLLWTLVMRHRFLRGRGHAFHRLPMAPDDWAKRTVDLLGPLMLGGLTKRLRTRFMNVYSSLFYLPVALWIVVTVALVLFAVVVFDFRQGLVSPTAWSPVWSANGLSFGWLLFVGIMSVQLMLMVALLQFVLQWLACAEVLRLLAQHPLAPAYKLVAKSLMPQGLVPKRLHIEQLQVLLEEMRVAKLDVAAGQHLLVCEMRRKIRNRWFTSRAWTKSIQPAIAAACIPARPWTCADKQLAKCVATAAVLVVRALLSRLTVSLITLGPCLAILIGMQATTSFQGSHRLLALIWVDVIAVVVVVLGAFIQMDRDHTLSLITNTEPGQVNWNFDLLSKIAVYAVLPVLLLFVSQFPTLGASLADMFGSVPSIP